MIKIGLHPRDYKVEAQSVKENAEILKEEQRLQENAKILNNVQRWKGIWENQDSQTDKAFI
jgi:hypothetical protein